MLNNYNNISSLVQYCRLTYEVLQFKVKYSLLLLLVIVLLMSSSNGSLSTERDCRRNIEHWLFNKLLFVLLSNFLLLNVYMVFELFSISIFEERRALDLSINEEAGPSNPFHRLLFRSSASNNSSRRRLSIIIQGGACGCLLPQRHIVKWC